MRCGRNTDGSFESGGREESICQSRAFCNRERQIGQMSRSGSSHPALQADRASLWDQSERTHAIPRRVFIKVDYGTLGIKHVAARIANRRRPDVARHG